MSPSPDHAAAWTRLGELLARRRVELDPRYQNRTTFSAERGLDYRLAYDIEEAKRTNFRRTTLAGVAVAYSVTLDSMYAALNGGELEPAAAPRTAQTGPLRAVPDHDSHDGSRADGTSPEAVAESLLAQYVAQYGDSDRILRLLASRPGASAETRLREVLEWLRVNLAPEKNGTVG